MLMKELFEGMYEAMLSELTHNLKDAATAPNKAAQDKAKEEAKKLRARIKETHETIMKHLKTTPAMQEWKKEYEADEEDGKVISWDEWFKQFDWLK